MSEQIVFTAHTHLDVRVCTCGMTFAVPAKFIEQRRSDHKTFYCPSGHSLHFPGESETEQLQKKLTQKEKELQWKCNTLRECKLEKEEILRSRAALKGVVTKKKRELAQVKGNGES